MLANILRIEPPPETDDVKVLSDWCRKFYERITLTPNILTITASNDDLDVSGYSVVFADTSDNSIVLGGLKGGVVGQSIVIYKRLTANNLTIEHQEGVGTQDILTDGSGDIILGNKGGVYLVCDETASNWMVISSHTRT